MRDYVYLGAKSEESTAKIILFFVFSISIISFLNFRFSDLDEKYIVGFSFKTS